MCTHIKWDLSGAWEQFWLFDFIIFSFHFHLFCKKQLTERNCTIKLENWLKYNSSNMQLQIKLQVQIGWAVNVNDLLRMLTGKERYCVQTGLAFLNNIQSIKLRSSCWEESLKLWVLDLKWYGWLVCSGRRVWRRWWEEYLTMQKRVLSASSARWANEQIWGQLRHLCSSFSMHSKFHLFWSAHVAPLHFNTPMYSYHYTARQLRRSVL